jgi:hypothetical protein
MTEKRDRALGATRVHADSRTTLSNHVNALATPTTIKRIVSIRCSFFSQAAPAELEPKPQMAGQLAATRNPSHPKPVDDKGQMICPPSPNHPAQVFKNREP